MFCALSRATAFKRKVRPFIITAVVFVVATVAGSAIFFVILPGPTPQEGFKPIRESTRPAAGRRPLKHAITPTESVVETPSWKAFPICLPQETLSPEIDGRFTGVVLGVCLLCSLAGCEFAKQQVLLGFRRYFPLAQLVPQRGGLEVQTGIEESIGCDLCIELFRSLASKDLRRGCQLAGYRFVALYLGGYTIIWLPARPDGFRVVTLGESHNQSWIQAPLSVNSTHTH
jgi:hypothetical protein